MQSFHVSVPGVKSTGKFRRGNHRRTTGVDKRKSTGTAEIRGRRNRADVRLDPRRSPSGSISADRVQRIRRGMRKRGGRRRRGPAGCEKRTRRGRDREERVRTCVARTRVCVAGPWRGEGPGDGGGVGGGGKGGGRCGEGPGRENRAPVAAGLTGAGREGGAGMDR